MSPFPLIVLNLKEEIAVGEKWPTRAFLECSGYTSALYMGRIPCTSSLPISSAIDFCLASFLDRVLESHCSPHKPNLGTSYPTGKNSDSPTFDLSALGSQGSIAPRQNLKISGSIGLPLQSHLVLGTQGK